VRVAYDEGQRCFGENYVQEMVEKAAELPDDIEWHFIGHLQSNKCKTVLGVKNLAMVETVDSLKLATKLSRENNVLNRKPLKVMVQVNTSGEESKSGVPPEEAISLVRHIRSEECDGLSFAGLMTIGKIDTSPRPECFKILADIRKRLCDEEGLEEKDVELSMGMSNDYVSAIELGSTNIRVGSTIFGARPTF